MDPARTVKPCCGDVDASSTRAHMPKEVALLPESFPRFAPFTDRDIERFLVGELDEERARDLEAAAKQDPALRAHLDERRAEKRAFDQLHPTPAFLTERPKGRSRRWLAIPAVLAAAIAVVPVVLLDDGPAIVARGDVSASADLVVKRAARLFVLEEPGVLLRAQDALRIDLKLTGDDERSLIIALKSGCPTRVGHHALPPRGRCARGFGDGGAAVVG